MPPAEGASARKRLAVRQTFSPTARPGSATPMSASTRMPAVRQRLRDARSLNGNLTTGQWASLTAWKVLLGARGVWNGLGGYAVLRRRGERWAARWARQWGQDSSGLSRWLARQGAGVFWFPVNDRGAWAREHCSRFDLAIATAAVGGTMDLLGTGPVEIGSRPTWRRDLYTGFEWPLVEAHRIGLQTNAGSDIRTVWE